MPDWEISAIPTLTRMKPSTQGLFAMPNLRFQRAIAIRSVSGTILSVFLLANPAVILAHGGHGDAGLFHSKKLLNCV